MFGLPRLTDTTLNTQAREITNRLKALNAPQHEINGCKEKWELLAMLERYQRATPQTVAKSSTHAKSEGSSSAAGASLFSSVSRFSGGAGLSAAYMGGISQAIPIKQRPASGGVCVCVHVAIHAHVCVFDALHTKNLHITFM